MNECLKKRKTPGKEVPGMEAFQFTKEDTNLAKGIFILMMLVHHLFYSEETFAGYGVSFLGISTHQAVVLAQYFKLCIAGFVMLTFYGLTRKYMAFSREELKRKMVSLTLKRYVSLGMSFFYIYAVSLFAALLLKADVKGLYGTGEKFWLGYGIIDAFGMADFFHTPTLNATWWYMAFAITLIFLFPILYQLYERFGILFVGVMAILPGALQMEQTYYGLCAFTMAFGIFTAKTNLFVRIRAYGNGNLSAKFIKAVWCGILLYVGYQLLFYNVSASWYFALSAWTWIYICYEFLAPIKGISQLLRWIGKYSMEIFLIHTFLYYYYARDFIYSFQNGILITGVLLLGSLGISIALRFLKKVICYQKLSEWVQEKVLSLYIIFRGYSDEDEK